MLDSLLRHRGLIARLTEREVVGRYRGSLMGLAWSFLHPAMMLGIYTFFFSVIFRARWQTPGGEAAEGTASFAIMLFIGLMVHGLFAECLTRAPGLVVGNPNFVKKVVFPLEVLPVVTVASALFHALVSLVILLVAQLAVAGSIPPTALLLPFVMLPLLLLSAGACWLLSSLGVFLRDIGQVMGVVVTVLLFMSPVFYPIASLPERYQPWFRLNPLTAVIEDARAVLVLGHGFDWTAWTWRMGACTLVALGGYWWFQKTRKGFADVL